MKSVIIVMSLLGCADDGGQCQLIDTVAGNWPTIEACQSAQHEHLATLKADEWPVLMASCNEKSDAGQAVAALHPPAPQAGEPEVTQAPLAPPSVTAEAPQPQEKPADEAANKSKIPGMDTVKSAVTWVRDGSVLVMRHTGDLVKKTGRYGLDLITGGNGS